MTRVSDEARLAAKVLHLPLEEALTEVAYLERLQHEHVVRLHDSVVDSSGPDLRLAMITDLAEGGSLGSAIAGRGHLTMGELVTVLTPVARTLHDLHGQGLVHGDLSPANVLLDADGKPMLADFGVARLAADRDASAWGTEGFVAPEVLAGEAPGSASDVYALGALAWTALVGEAPPPAALRPHLPDVAPQASASACDLILSALSHTAQTRPDAGSFALAIWDSAPPEPAPRAGSEGARAVTSDPWAGLTQRIRERAVHPEPEPLPRWYQTRFARRTMVAAASGGVLVGAGVVWPEPAPMQVQAHLVAADARGAALHQPDAPVTVKPRPKRPPRATSTSDPESQPAAKPKATKGPPRRVSPAHVVDLRDDPETAVQRLVDARAHAWTGGTSHLAQAFTANSVAWKRDSTDLRRAASAGARYDGLSFLVRSATVRSATSTSAVVATVIDRSSYRVVGQDEAAAPARTGQRVVLNLTHTDRGWRIANWTAA